MSVIQDLAALWTEAHPGTPEKSDPINVIRRIECAHQFGATLSACLHSTGMLLREPRPHIAQYSETYRQSLATRAVMGDQFALYLLRENTRRFFQPPQEH